MLNFINFFELDYKHSEDENDDDNNRGSLNDTCIHIEFNE